MASQSSSSRCLGASWGERTLASKDLPGSLCDEQWWLQLSVSPIQQQQEVKPSLWGFVGWSSWGSDQLELCERRAAGAAARSCLTLWNCASLSALLPAPNVFHSIYLISI